MAKVGDKYILYSGEDVGYYIKIVNVNDFREPNMKYAVDICNGNGMYFEDVMFVGDEFLSKCRRAMSEKEIILDILNRNLLKVYHEDDKHIEFENGYGFKDIIIDFDEDGNVVNIGC